MHAVIGTIPRGEDRQPDSELSQVARPEAEGLSAAASLLRPRPWQRTRHELLPVIRLTASSFFESRNSTSIAGLRRAVPSSSCRSTSTTDDRHGSGHPLGLSRRSHAPNSYVVVDSSLAARLGSLRPSSPATTVCRPEAETMIRSGSTGVTGDPRQVDDHATTWRRQGYGLSDLGCTVPLDCRANQRCRLWCRAEAPGQAHAFIDESFRDCATFQRLQKLVGPNVDA